MSRLFIETIQKTIDDQYKLKRAGRTWSLNGGAHGSQAIQIRTPDRNSVAFSLDNDNRPPLAFFSGNPPEHLKKMCDAIIVMAHKGKTYLFIIEAKTANSGDYKKQLNNGRYFCRWLEELCREYQYLDTDLIYIGLLIWWPRKHAISKGTTSHKNPRLGKISAGKFDHSLEVRNQKHIALTDVVDACRKKT